MKTCARCKLEKPREAFNRNNAAPDSLHYYCRDCDKAMNAERYAAKCRAEGKPTPAEKRAKKIAAIEAKPDDRRLNTDH